MGPISAHRLLGRKGFVTAFWTRLIIGSAAFTVIAAAAAISPIGAGRIESRVQKAADAQLLKNGVSWARAEAQGRTLSLSGAAPSEDARNQAIEYLAQAPGVDRIDAAAVKIAETPRKAPPPESFEPDQIVQVDPAASAADCQSAINRTLNGRRLTFRRDSARLGDEGRALLDDVIHSLGVCEGQSIAIEGHTDAAGPESDNLALSERRAKAVEAYLLQAGLPLTFVVHAFGETRPIASNRSAQGRAANRRIDFVVEAANTQTRTESD
jgi:outer membrane protein OmpA-like peptidoglycan-associated protein